MQGMSRWMLFGLAILAGCAEDTTAVGMTIGRARADAGAPSSGGAGSSEEERPLGRLQDAGSAPASSCGPPSGRNACDAITGWPCDVAAGWTCDFSRRIGGFDCFSPPNDVGFCGACSVAEGLTCSAGLTCGNTGWCERICCSDSDCGIGTCYLGSFSDPLVASFGYCKEEGLITCGGDGASPAKAVPAAVRDASANNDPGAAVTSAPADASIPPTPVDASLPPDASLL